MEEIFCYSNNQQMQSRCGRKERQLWRGADIWRDAMEVKVQVKQLKRLAQELETVAKQLASSIARLEKPHRHPDRPEIAKQLRTLGSSLKEQAETCKDMAAVLKQAASLYEKTEEAVIQAAETETRQYEETLRTVSLGRAAQIKMTLDV